MKEDILFEENVNEVLVQAQENVGVQFRTGDRISAMMKKLQY